MRSLESNGRLTRKGDDLLNPIEPTGTPRPEQTVAPATERAKSQGEAVQGHYVDDTYISADKRRLVKKSSSLLDGLSTLSFIMGVGSVWMVLLRRSQFWLAMAISAIGAGFALVAGKKAVDRYGAWLHLRQSQFDGLK